MNPESFNEALEFINEKCFYLDAHQRLFKAMYGLHSTSRPTDYLTVTEALRASGDLEAVGGGYELIKLQDSVVNGAKTAEYCRLVLQSYMKREIIRISNELISEGYEPGDPFELLEKAESSLHKIRQLVETRSYQSIDSVLVETITHLEAIRHREDHLTGVTSGFQELDKVTCGWQGTDLIILAARPSVGKTALALALCRNAASKDPVGFFSLEMSRRQLAQRVLSSQSGLPLWFLRNGKISDAGMKDLYDNGIIPISKCKIFIDDTPALNIQELKAKARRMVNKDKCKLIIIDYLQLITTREKFNRKDLEVGHISAQLKALAKELDVPVIALSQLSRGVEQRGDSEPKLSDLRESGAIEQDADIVMFLWRPAEDDLELKDYIYLKIEKNRNGTLEKFLGEFLKETQRWQSLKVLDKAGMPDGNWEPVKGDFS